jgi:hypothetical protein
MQIQFFLDGVVVPALYDFELLANGELHPAKDQRGNKQYVAVLLENEGDGITLAQAVAVNTLLVMNPQYHPSFYFETRTDERRSIH